MGGSWHCLGTLPAGEGPGGGTILTEGPGSRLPNPSPCTTLVSETPDPKKGLPFIGFPQKAGAGGGWSLDLGPSSF